MLATRRCQTGATDLQEIICYIRIQLKLRAVLKVLSQRLKQKQEELDDFEKIVAEIRNFSKDLAYLKNMHSENQR